MKSQPNRSALTNAVLHAKPNPSGVFVAQEVSPDVPAPQQKVSPDVPACPAMSPTSRNGKTKPTTLSALQLAAARMFAKGGRTLAIADALKLNRRTLSRWQQLPAFRAEIERVHRDLSRPPARPEPSPGLHASEREFLERAYTSAVRQFMRL